MLMFYELSNHSILTFNFHLAYLVKCLQFQRIWAKYNGEDQVGSDYVVDKSKRLTNQERSTLGLAEPNLPKSSRPMSVSKRVFGTMKDGLKVHEYRLINENGVEVSILDYGATVRDIIVPDRNGEMANVSLGFETLEEYLTRVLTLDVLQGDMPIELLAVNLFLMVRNMF